MADLEKIHDSLIEFARTFARTYEDDYDMLRGLSLYLLGKATIASCEAIAENALRELPGDTLEMDVIPKYVEAYLSDTAVSEIGAILIAGVGVHALYGYTFDITEEEVVWRKHGETDENGNPLLDDKIILYVSRELNKCRVLSPFFDAHISSVLETDEQLSDFHERYHALMLTQVKSIVWGGDISPTDSDFEYARIAECFGG